MKDLERGLVDFPSQRGGRPVFLCWELGETNVSHWHGVEETYTHLKLAEEKQPAQ